MEVLKKFQKLVWFQEKEGIPNISGAFQSSLKYDRLSRNKYY